MISRVVSFFFSARRICIIPPPSIAIATPMASDAYGQPDANSTTAMAKIGLYLVIEVRGEIWIILYLTKKRA